MYKTLLSILVVLIANLALAQQSSPWRFGGGLGVNFGNNSFFGINVAPAVGYAVSNNLELGASVGYQYAKDDFIKQNLFSFGPYAHYNLMQNLFVRGQYEYFTGNFKTEQSNIKTDINESALWLGGGYRQIIGNNAEFRVGALYNVLYDEGNSIFASGFQPFVGVSFGL